MKAMVLKRIASLADEPEPLVEATLPDPRPRAGEVLLRVATCGVCHTELDEIEGRTPPPRLPVVLGHQVIGRVADRGDGATRHTPGARVGVGWIHSSTGAADENLSPRFVATGRDVDGGYAEWMTVPEAYAFPIPGRFDDLEAAPLLCAGAIGWRALRLTELRDGQALGLMGFGGSAHLVLQIVRGRFPNAHVHVFARDADVRAFALTLGASSAGDPGEPPPVPLDAVIDTTPAWQPVVHSLAALRPGGRLVINAIRKEERDKQALLGLSYERHLWMERELKSVANITGADIAEFLPIAAALGVRAEVTAYPLEEANRALRELQSGKVRGAKVLVVEGG
jgi:propanol-preferring alcohol dehydrogenase